MIHRKTAQEREIRRMFANEPLQMDLHLLELQDYTDYDLQMRKIDVRRKYKDISEYDAEVQYLQINKEYKRIATEKEFKQLMLDIHIKYNRITEKDYSLATIELIDDPEQRQLAVLDHLLKFGEITQDEFEKELSTFNELPWFKFTAMLVDDGNISMNVTYNELFLKKCKEDGHPGETEDEIIEYFIKDFGRKLHADDEEVPEAYVQMEDSASTKLKE